MLCMHDDNNNNNDGIDRSFVARGTGMELFSPLCFAK